MGNANGPAFSDAPADAPVQPCGKPDNKPRHWLEIELVGEDDKPIPYAEYRVKLPGGTEARGYLDEEGFARLDGIEQAGSCLVCFPELDREAWTKIATLGPKAAGAS